MGQMSEQQRKIVALIGQGFTRDEIADELDLNPATVRTYIGRMCGHFDCTMKQLPAAVAALADD